MQQQSGNLLSAVVQDLQKSHSLMYQLSVQIQQSLVLSRDVPILKEYHSQEQQQFTTGHSKTVQNLKEYFFRLQHH
jgi:hypothetical protein